MPLYEYICSECGSEFEKLVRFSDVDINSPECPKCKSSNTNRRLSLIASYNPITSLGGGGSSGGGCGSSGGFT